jgi:hypothetical protein
METTLQAPVIINKPRKTSRIAFFITLVLIAAAIAVGKSDIDGMNGGFALIAILGFLAIMSLITALVYLPRAKAFDKLVSGMHPLAHWTYTAQEWETFLKEDLAEAKAISKSMWKLIVIISLVIGAGLWLWSGDSLYMLIIGGIIVLISITAWLAPRIRNRAVQNGNQEVYIGDSSVLVGGAFQTWTQLGARLAAVGIDTEKAIPILRIQFYYPTLQGPQEEIIRVPVPAGKIEEAKKVVNSLEHQVIPG